MTECELDGVFEKVNGVYVVRTVTGEMLPVLFCPLCGTRIDYKE